MSESRYPCPDCSKVYKTKKNLDKHSLICGQVAENYPCSNCRKIYKTEKNLEKHMLTCGAATVTLPSYKCETYKCETCCKSYKTEKNLEKHSLTCGKVAEGYPCPGCSRVLKSKGALTRHLSKCNVDTLSTFECVKCNKKYVSEEALAQHVKLCQPPLDNGFNCVCGRVCKSTRGLNHHQMKCSYVDVNKNKYDMAKSKVLTNFFDDPDEEADRQGEWYSEHQHGLCLYMAHNVYMTNKWAMFNLDGTLIKTKSGKTTSIATSDWTWFSESHPKKLQRLITKGFSIIVISNQDGDEKDHSKVREKFNQIQEALEDTPLVAAFATDCNLYRKPNAKIIEYLECFLSTKIDLENSFYVGNNAGRPGDHSCCDRKFADNVGVPFYTIERFLDKEHKDEDFTWGFNPSEYLDEYALSVVPPISPNSPQELVLMCGYPGSGKTTFIKKHLFNHTYVSRDNFKCKSLSPIIKKALTEGQSVVVDNTNLYPETRDFYINLAKDHNVPCKCYFLNLPLELCKHLSRVRNAHSDNTIKVVTDVAYDLLESKFIEPITDEGIDEVIHVPFIPSFNSEEEESAFRKWTM